MNETRNQQSGGQVTMVRSSDADPGIGDQRRGGSSWRSLVSAALCVSLSLPVTVVAQSQPATSAQPESREAQEQKQEDDAAAPRSRLDRSAVQQNLQGQPGVVGQGRPIRQPASRNRAQEIIDKVDPAALNRLLGAEVDIEFVGGQIILKGPEEAVKALELLIQSLDQEIPQKELRVVQVFERDAKDVAKQVQDAVRNTLRTANQRPEEEVTLTALSANIILIGALPDDIAFIEDIIHQVDEVPDPLGRVELMVFPVKFRKASEVGIDLEKTLSTLQKASGRRPEDSKLQILPNNANNTITVTARESERAKIQAIIDTIDVEPVKGWGEVKVTVFPLLHSKAKDLSETIKNLLSSQSSGGGGSVSPGGQGGGGGSRSAQAAQELIYRLRVSKASATGQITEMPPIDLQRSLKIIPDDGTNSLIVATIEENVGPVGELIRLLDGVPLGEEMSIRLFPLRFADAETVSELLTDMFEQGKKLPEDPDGSGKEAVPAGAVGRALVYNISISQDVRTNTLIVSGREEQLELVDRVVAQLDKPTTSLRFPLRLLPLTHADATRVAEIMTNLFDKRVEAAEKTGATKSALERERVFLTVDARTNTLILSASEENFAEITSISRQLDVKPADWYDQIRVIRLSRLRATDLKEKLTELWARKAELRATEELVEDKPVIAVDDRSNALIIASSVEDFEEIQRLVTVLESQPLTQETRLFKLEFADATVMAGMLEKLFEGIAAGVEGAEAPTILPDMRSNALVVAGSPDMMERVEDLLKRMDVETGPKTAVFKVYPLRYGSAAKLSARMQELFDSRSGEQDAPRTPIVVLPDDSSNSLVASASRDDHLVIAELLELIDRPSNISRQFRIFPLKRAKAVKVTERLESLFKAQGESSTGRADATAVEADERTNSLIVWGSPTEIENISEVITRLDTATPAVDMMVKVIQLKQALATDFAKLLVDTLIGGDSADAEQEQAIIVSFTQTNPDGSKSVRKLLRQDIRVQPDPRTNSLMVMAPADSMEMLEVMIQDFDQIRPVTSEIRLFQLQNSDADTMVTKLTDLFKASEGGEGKAQSQLIFGEMLDGVDLVSVGQEVRFASDPRTNTLIVAGAEVYLRMVEQLVRHLDAQEVEERQTMVYQVKHTAAENLASAVKSFVQQEQDVLGASEDETSQMRRQERQVSIESIGKEDEGGSQLIVGTSRRSYQRTMDMIQQLDRAEPQVMISVLIAEVTLQDSIELGVEIAGQELDFTRTAVLGPNGVLDGPDFDWVSGTDLGAAGAGLGGFNFTIAGEDFSFLLHALQADDRLEVLSRPILLVRNGQEGKITIADQVPFIQNSQINDTGSTNSSVGREDVGIILTATPHISPDGYVTIKLKQELSNIASENVQLTEGVTSPVFQTREVDTNVTVRDGETVVIGGLIQSRESEAETKVPLIGDLPLLGSLFRTNRVNKRKTELLVVLTVDILRTDDDMHQMSVEQRDKYILPDSILQHPLMEGLRITPEESAMGPKPERGRRSTPSSPVSPTAPPRQRELYGPRPRTYGPIINPPPTTTTASANGSPLFGPTPPKGNSDEQR